MQANSVSLSAFIFSIHERKRVGQFFKDEESCISYNSWTITGKVNSPQALHSSKRNFSSVIPHLRSSLLWKVHVSSKTLIYLYFPLPCACVRWTGKSFVDNYFLGIALITSLSHFSTTLCHRCSTVHQFDHTTNNCAAIPLNYNITMPLFHHILVPLCHCSTQYQYS